VVNAGLAIGLAPAIGYMAAATATTTAGWAMVVLLWFGSRRMGSSVTLDDRLRWRIWRIVLASALLGVVLWVGRIALEPVFAVTRPGALALLILGGTVIYFIISHVLNAFRLSELKSAVKRSG
jgi:putative peptidoglycan lipid II flippase